MLSRNNEWIWDSWYVVDDNGILHAFYLNAPKSLDNPDLRHFNARVGHSVSNDGITWEHLPEALGPTTGEGFDCLATWTGSVVQDNGIWHMFFTGIGSEHRELQQKIGLATSPDLLTWTRVSDSPILSAKSPYALLGNSYDGAEHFRDPWVFPHEGKWHMLVTASDETGIGTIGHGTSADLKTWTLQPALTNNSQFRQLEVTETAFIDGQWFLFFCAGPNDVIREGIEKGFGTYCVPADGPLGPFHFEKTQLLAEGIYAARVVWFLGKWNLFGFLDTGIPGGFQGVICDRIPLKLHKDGLLALDQ